MEVARCITGAWSKVDSPDKKSLSRVLGLHQGLYPRGCVLIRCPNSLNMAPFNRKQQQLQQLPVGVWAAVSKSEPKQLKGESHSGCYPKLMTIAERWTVSLTAQSNALPSLYTVWLNTHDTADTSRSHAPFYPHTLICLSSFVLGSSSHDQPRINASNPPVFLAEIFRFKLVCNKDRRAKVLNNASLSPTLLLLHPCVTKAARVTYRICSAFVGCSDRFPQSTLIIIIIFS